jgi:molybdate/tungstate transport system substrate-binding protein
VRVESRGSAALARLIAADKRDPDLASVADTALFESVLRPPWYAVFASNAVVLAYDRETEGGRRIRDAGRENWYAPLLAGNVALGRTDPDRDPLGYRTLFALELASRYYDDAADLRAEIPARGQIYPETSLLSRFETGALDAAVVYRNMAVERGYDYLDLPTQIDLSAPEHVEEWYSTVSYTLPAGTTVRGNLIGYGSTVRRRRDPVIDVFEAQIRGEYLQKHGFLLPDGFPRYEGHAPDGIAD